MRFHGMRRTGADAQLADDAFILVKGNLSGFRIDAERFRGTNGNASAAVCASLLIANDILT